MPKNCVVVNKLSQFFASIFKELLVSLHGLGKEGYTTILTLATVASAVGCVWSYQIDDGLNASVNDVQLENHFLGDVVVGLVLADHLAVGDHALVGGYRRV